MVGSFKRGTAVEVTAWASIRGAEEVPDSVTATFSVPSGDPVTENAAFAPAVDDAVFDEDTGLRLIPFRYVWQTSAAWGAGIYDIVFRSTEGPYTVLPLDETIRLR